MLATATFFSRSSAGPKILTWEIAPNPAATSLPLKAEAMSLQE